MSRPAIVYHLKRGAAILKEEQARVNATLKKNGLTQVDEVIEQETRPSRRAWPVLRKAVDQIKANGGCLVIARLGRLRWSSAFLRILHDSQVPLVCCDFPDLCERTVEMQLKVALNKAQHVSRRRADEKRRVVGFTSETRRTDKRFLAGVKTAVENSSKVRRNRANNLYSVLVPEMQRFRAAGQTFDGVAESLNRAGHLTTVGTPFNGPTVYRIMQRAGAL